MLRGENTETVKYGNNKSQVPSGLVQSQTHQKYMYAIIQLRASDNDVHS